MPIFEGRILQSEEVFSRAEGPSDYGANSRSEGRLERFAEYSQRNRREAIVPFSL